MPIYRVVVHAIVVDRVLFTCHRYVVPAIVVLHRYDRFALRTRFRFAVLCVWVSTTAGDRCSRCYAVYATLLLPHHALRCVYTFASLHVLLLFLHICSTPAIVAIAALRPFCRCLPRYCYHTPFTRVTATPLLPDRLPAHVLYTAPTLFCYTFDRCVAAHVDRSATAVLRCRCRCAFVKYLFTVVLPVCCSLRYYYCVATACATPSLRYSAAGVSAGDLPICDLPTLPARFTARSVYLPLRVPIVTLLMRSIVVTGAPLRIHAVTALPLLRLHSFSLRC